MSRLRVWSSLVLAVVAVVGAVLSFDSLHKAAVPTFDDPLAYGFPLLVDALILGASLQFIAGARAGRPQAGWRLTAHAGVAGTIALNALAAPSLGAIPWHVTAPIVWSVLVELTARTVLGEWMAEHKPPLDRVPARLWVTAPVESARVWLRLARRVEGAQAAARVEVGAYAAAVEALRASIPGREGRAARRILRRQLRAGTLQPGAVLAACGWLDPESVPRTAQAILRAALGAALDLGPEAAGQVPDPTPAVDEPASPVEPSAAKIQTERTAIPDAALGSKREATDQEILRLFRKRGVTGRPSAVRALEDAGWSCGGPRIQALIKRHKASPDSPEEDPPRLHAVPR